MRVAKFVRSDGENWQLVRIRCSKTCSLDRLYQTMHANGWVRFNKFRNKIKIIKQKLAKQHPGTNWKEMRIPMMAADFEQLPAEVQKMLGVVPPAANDPVLEEGPFFDDVSSSKGFSLPS